MKKKIFTFFSIIILCFLFEVLLVDKAEAVDISSCGYVISTPGTYNVKKDISHIGSGACILIDSDNVVLDCQDHWLSGDDSSNSYGIQIYEGRDFTTIQNCKVKDFSIGVYVDSSASLRTSDVTMSNIVATGCWPSGVSAVGNIENVQITNLEVYDNHTYGFHFGGSNITLADSYLHENLMWDAAVLKSGIAPDPCNATFTNVTGSGGRPIEYYHDAAFNFTSADGPYSELILCDADGTTIDGITIDGSDTIGNNGLFVHHTDNTTIQNITSSYNFKGINLEYSSFNRITNNTTKYNGNKSPVSAIGEGIYIYGGSDNTVSDNIVNYNYQHGIYIISSSNNIISNNNLNGNYAGLGRQRWGLIMGGSSSNNTVSNNSANRNEFGMAIGGSSNILIDNTTNNSDQSGLNISGNNHTITRHITLSNRWNGINISSGTGNTITNATASGNAYGVTLQAGISSNNITDSDISNNTQYGIRYLDAPNNSASGNTICFNGTEDILCQNSDPQTDFSNNYCDSGNVCGGTCIPCIAYIDIGLRVFNGSETIAIAVWSLGQEANSPLRIAKDGNVYGIVLVDPGDPNDSGVRIQTSSGIKALRKYP